MLNNVTSKNLVVLLTLFFVSVSGFCQEDQISKISTLQLGNVDVPESHPSAALQIDDTDRGVLFPRMTTSQRDAIVNPTPGLTVYNLTKNCIEMYEDGSWFNTCGANDLSSNGTAVVSSWECSTNSTGSMLCGMPVTGVTQTVTANVVKKGSYTLYTMAFGIVFSSSGIFTSTGPHTIVLKGSGTPTVSGSFTFALNTMPSCSFQRAVAGVLPSAPINLYAVSGDTHAKVFFTPVLLNGNGTTTYKVISNPEGIIATGNASPITISGLKNGTSYSFTILATNSLGSSILSLPSNSVVPAGVPDSPIITSATRGNTMATIYFSPPQNNGGSSIQRYTILTNPGGIFQHGINSPFVVTGLTNGISYTFKIIATNNIGNSPYSEPSNSVIPATIPNSPLNVTATPSPFSAIVSFQPPNNGGDPISNYIVTAHPSGISTTGLSSPITVNGLTNGESYSFTVEAVNSLGKSLPSEPSGFITPALTVPGIPTITNITYNNGTATISFNPPTDTGGTAITSYTITTNTGISVTGTTSPIVIPGLVTGINYTFSIAANNSVGTSSSSTPIDSTPLTVPNAPLILNVNQINQTTASISYSIPFDGGAPIVSYTITANPGGITYTTTDTTLNMTDLIPGQTYTFTVVATNKIGSSVLSEASIPLQMNTTGSYLTNYYNGVITN